MHHLRKIYGFKGSSADKASIDLRHTHKLMSILWVHAAAILNAHLLGNFLPYMPALAPRITAIVALASS